MSRAFIDPVPGPFVAIDFETADHGADSACAIGMVRVEGGRVVRRVRQLIKPPREQMFFTHIHGITLDEVADKPVFGRAWLLLKEVLDGAVFLAAHNAGFDRAVLEACCETAGLEAPDLPWVCTVRQARRTLGIYPAHLGNVARVLNISLNHHDALSDAEACARVVMLARSTLKRAVLSRS
ncbi:MAG: 3'-5' exonuclease [Planctomycetes bacterium]|nr:3'-5' exonuclease [Planctomycetota bacterium]